MKIKKSVFAAALAAVLALGLIVGATAAENVKKQIVANEDYTIAITLDGEVQIPVNVNGDRVYPISYNGTTYLPIRTVANLAGLEVDWDQANQTVLLFSKPADGVDLIDTLKYYYRSNNDCKQYQSADKQATTISGINCSHWIEIYTTSYAQPGYTSEISFNADGKYETLSFQYYSEKDIILRVLGDNDYVLWEKEIKGGQVAQAAVDVKLLNTNGLTFQTEVLTPGDSNYIKAYVFDARLK